MENIYHKKPLTQSNKLLEGLNLHSADNLNQHYCSYKQACQLNAIQTVHFSTQKFHFGAKRVNFIQIGASFSGASLHF